MSSIDTEEYINVFNSLDRNRDGAVSCAELKQGLVSCGFGDENLKSLMEFLDSNHDGKISLDEFLEFFE
ncbi:unnamed protein product [Heterobilharzia americana]|nr:unnamed protein product [Heterobilharzia americana]CAH8669393.1 unnamed protein product [Heterobilharzia americana]